MKREDLGDAEYPYHSAAHLAAWSALSVFFLAIVWCFLDLFQEIWEREMIFAALSIPVMAAAVFYPCCWMMHLPMFIFFAEKE